MGTDAKLYTEYIAQYQEEYPDVSVIVKKHRFREFKPFFISKPEQQ
jgi:hypothetical protein